MNYKKDNIINRPPFSADLIRYVLLLCYTSRHTYKLLLEKFPLPSFSLFEKIQSGGVGSITAVKSFLEKGHLSQDCVLLVDEIYLQKGTQLNSEMVQMKMMTFIFIKLIIYWCKKTVPSVVKACPEVTVNGE